MGIVVVITLGIEGLRFMALLLTVFAARGVGLFEAPPVVKLSLSLPIATWLDVTILV